MKRFVYWHKTLVEIKNMRIKLEYILLYVFNANLALAIQGL